MGTPAPAWAALSNAWPHPSWCNLVWFRCAHGWTHQEGKRGSEAKTGKDTGSPISTRQCHLVPRFWWCHFTQHHCWCIHRAHATWKHGSVNLLPSPHGTRAYMQIAVFCAEQRSDNAIQQDSLALSHALLHRWFQERKINSSQPFLIKVTVWRRSLFYFHISHSTWTNTCNLQNRG